MALMPSVLAQDCAGARIGRLWACSRPCRPVSILVTRHRQRCSPACVQAQASGHMPPWAADAPTWNPSTRMQMNHLMDLFTIADKDGNGILDRHEVRHLLQSDARCTSGLCQLAQIHLISDDDLDEIMDQYDTDHKGGLSFSQFMDLILDGVLLDGSLDEFRAVFTAADADADGALNAAELAAALRTITGEIVCQEDVHDIMAAADVDGDSTIDFSEFLDLFRSKLMDLHTLLEYLKMKPQLSPQASSDGATLDDMSSQPSSGSSSITQAISSSSSSSSLLQLSSEGELNDLMRQLAPEVLLVVMFGLSGDAVCQATTQAVQELAAAYPTMVFAKIHIDSSPEAKALFKQILLGRYVPAFYLFKNGQLCHSHADSNVVILEQYLRDNMPLDEQPEQPVFGVGSNSRYGGSWQQQQQQGAAAAANSEAEPYVMQGYSLADLVYDSL